MHLLPKIHKHLVNVPGRPVISNCSMPIEKASQFLDHHLQPIISSGCLTLRTLMTFCQNLKWIFVSNIVTFCEDIIQE